MDLYKVLGVDRNADERTIKKSYFDLAKRHHPDKGGDAEEFKKIQKAYDVLGTSDSRSFYDQTGQIPGEGGNEMGDPMGGMPQGFPFDLGGLFGGMFGGGMPFGPGGPRKPNGAPSSRRRGKAPPKIHEINLTLDDFYHGRKLKINFEKQRFCTGCKGDGYTSFTMCTDCGGMGVVTRQMMMGPGMAMMSTAPCGACQGNGQKTGPKCSACNGKCFTNEAKTLDVAIEPGMKPGDKMYFSNECSDSQEYAEAGDVHILLGEADEESIWKRDGIYLRTTLNLNLKDSLLGSKHTLQGHPGFKNGYEIEIPAGSIHMAQIHVPNGGMPIRGNLSNLKGDAIITLRVTLTEKEHKALDTNKQLLHSVFTSD
jgi:DnaJ-class molecular chaperone